MAFSVMRLKMPFNLGPSFKIYREKEDHFLPHTSRGWEREKMPFVLLQWSIFVQKEKKKTLPN